MKAQYVTLILLMCFVSTPSIAEGYKSRHYIIKGCAWDDPNPLCYNNAFHIPKHGPSPEQIRKQEAFNRDLDRRADEYIANGGRSRNTPAPQSPDGGYIKPEGQEATTQPPPYDQQSGYNQPPPVYTQQQQHQPPPPVISPNDQQQLLNTTNKIIGVIFGR